MASQHHKPRQIRSTAGRARWALAACFMLAIGCNGSDRASLELDGANQALGLPDGVTAGPARPDLGSAMAQEINRQDQLLQDRAAAVRSSNVLGACPATAEWGSSSVRRLRCARGYIYINPQDKLQTLLLKEPFATSWVQLGGEQSSLGLPVAEEVDLVENGSDRPRKQAFEFGTLYYSRATGVRPLYVSEIAKRYDELDGPLGPLGFPDSASGPRAAFATFENGSISALKHDVNVRFFHQNMGLFPDVLYKGPNREHGLRGIVAMLREQAPDVVGLSEMWEEFEQSGVWANVQDLYPYAVMGRDSGVVGLGSGIMLLSRHPILEHDFLTYSACEGEDCGSRKGVIFARIAVPGPTSVDVYMTHTQNPTPVVSGPFVDGSIPEVNGALGKQVKMLGSFVRGTRDPKTPAIVMGDLNYNGLKLQRLLVGNIGGEPEDLWLTSGNGGPGVTFDKYNNFASAGPPLSDSRRHKEGQRLDYFLAYPGRNYRAHYENTRVVALPDSHGRDLSDHYGIMTTLRSVDEVEVSYHGPVPALTATLDGYHCLEETGGALFASRFTDSDEMVFKLSASSQHGVTAETPNWTAEMSIDPTERGHVVSHPTITLENPGRSVRLKAHAKEIDSWVSIDVKMRAGVIDLDDEDLVEAMVKPRQHHTLVGGDGAVYALSTTVRATRPRADRVAEVTVAPGSHGAWSAPAMCAPGSYATGYRVTVEADQGGRDDTALNAIELTCATPSDQARGSVQPHPGAYGTQHGLASCLGGGDFLTAARLKIEGSQGSGDDTAANDVEFTCGQSGSTLRAPGGAKWGSFQSAATQCPANTAVCGLSTRNEEYQGDDDDMGLTGLKLVCCAYTPASPWKRPSRIRYVPADFNGDRKTDLVITNVSGSYWYISNGDGSFRESYRRRDLPLDTDYVAGDFDGDGKSDLIITNVSGSYWYFSNGDGTFRELARRYELSRGNVEFTPGDFNGDGKTDLIVTTQSGSEWNLSKGDGTWDVSYVRRDLPLGRVKFTVGEFKPDILGGGALTLRMSRADVIITTASGSHWYRSKGDGTFEVDSVRTHLTLGQVEFTTGDFDGNGNTDLVVTTASGSYWYFTQDDGSWTYPLTRTDLTLHNVDFTAADFSGDGKTDLIVSTSSGASWQFSNGSGSFTERYSRRNLPRGVAQYTVARFDDNATADLVIATAGGSYWYFSGGDGSWTYPYTRTDLPL